MSDSDYDGNNDDSEGRAEEDPVLLKNPVKPGPPLGQLSSTIIPESVLEEKEAIDEDTDNLLNLNQKLVDALEQDTGANSSKPGGHVALPFPMDNTSIIGPASNKSTSPSGRPAFPDSRSPWWGMILLGCIYGFWYILLCVMFCCVSAYHSEELYLKDRPSPHQGGAGPVGGGQLKDNSGQATAGDSSISSDR